MYCAPVSSRVAACKSSVNWFRLIEGNFTVAKSVSFA
jgi:hypothetical protein